MLVCSQDPFVSQVTGYALIRSRGASRILRKLTASFFTSEPEHQAFHIVFL